MRPFNLLLLLTIPNLLKQNERSVCVLWRMVLLILQHLYTNLFCSCSCNNRLVCPTRVSFPLSLLMGRVLEAVFILAADRSAEFLVSFSLCSPVKNALIFLWCAVVLKSYEWLQVPCWLPLSEFNDEYLTSLVCQTAVRHEVAFWRALLISATCGKWNTLSF